MTKSIMAFLALTIITSCAFESKGTYYIMPMGDSITAGHGGSDGGYRNLLFRNLNAISSDYRFVSVGFLPGAHEGRPGIGTSATTANIKASQTVAINRPDIVLLMIGTNDAVDRTPEELRTNFLALIAEIKDQKHDVKILLSRIPPWQNSDVYKKVNAVIDALPGMSDVWIVDNCTGFQGWCDGLHPNDAGYTFIAGQWLSKIKEIM